MFILEEERRPINEHFILQFIRKKSILNLEIYGLHWTGRVGKRELKLSSPVENMQWSRSIKLHEMEILK